MKRRWIWIMGRFRWRNKEKREMFLGIMCSETEGFLLLSIWCQTEYSSKVTWLSYTHSHTLSQSMWSKHSHRTLSLSKVANLSKQTNMYPLLTPRMHVATHIQSVICFTPTQRESNHFQNLKVHYGIFLPKINK